MARHVHHLCDLLENIIAPSKVISDQYDSHEITKKDGSVLVGRIIVEENEKVFLMTNPFAPNDLLAINESDIARKGTRAPSPTWIGQVISSPN